MSDKRVEFLNEAMSHKGEGGSWAWSVSGLGSGPWCAAFIVAVGNTVGGIIGTIIYKTYMAGEMAELSYKNGMGTYQVGGHSGGNPTPAAGDLVTYNRGSPTSGSGVFAAQHIGIVYSVDGDSFTTIEGNTSGGKVDSHTFKNNSSEVAVFYRPDWSKVGGSVSGNPSGQTSSGTSVVSGGDLYDTITTRADSIIREVGYLDSSNKLSTSSSNLRCSVINYTTQLGSFFKGAIGTGETGGTSGTAYAGTLVGGTNFEKIFNYFSSNGYTKQAAAGICGGLGGEAGTKNGDLILNSTEKGGLGGVGIGGWSLDYKTAFLNYASAAGEPWPNTSLRVQLNFLIECLNSGKSSVWNFPTGGKYVGKRAWPTQYKCTLAEFKVMTDIDRATGCWTACYEKCYYYNSNLGDRQTIAHNVYNSYA